MKPQSYDRVYRIVLLVLAMQAGGIAPGYTQHASGIIPFHRLGLSYQEIIGVDMGLLAYHTRYGYQRRNFYDISVGVESLFAKRFALVPKINFDAGCRSSLFRGATIGGGADIGWYTDFSNGRWRFTPKVGFTMGSMVRFYYGYHCSLPNGALIEIGRHRVSLEVNIAAVYDFSIGF